MNRAITVNDYLLALAKTYESVRLGVVVVEDIDTLKYPTSICNFSRAIVISDGKLKISNEIIEEINDEEPEQDYIALQNNVDVTNAAWVGIVSVSQGEDGKTICTLNVVTTDDTITVETIKEKTIESICSI